MSFSYAIDIDSDPGGVDHYSQNIIIVEAGKYLLRVTYVLSLQPPTLGKDIGIAINGTQVGQIVVTESITNGYYTDKVYEQ